MNPFRLFPLLLIWLLALPLAAQPVQWEERAPLSTPRFGLTAAVLNGQIYVLGGQDALGNILDVATRYDPHTNQWTSLPPMSKPRVNAAAVARNGKVFVIGGRSSDNTVLNDVEFFDPATNTWQPFQPIAVERQGLAAVLRDTSLFVAGGSNAADEILDSFEIYDEGAESWVDFEEEIRITGLIEAIGAASITVSGTTFAVNSNTEIRDATSNDITLNDLAVGMTVEIRGENDANGTLTATRIEVEDDGAEDVEVTGFIQALSASSLTVAGITFEVTSATEIEDANSNAIAFSDLAVGMQVEVRGEQPLSGTLVATRIEIVDANAEVRITGLIEAIGAASITVSGTTFAVNSNTEIRDANSNDITLDDLAVGMTVEIRGENDANGTLTATRIEVEDDGSEQVEVTDVIEALGSSSVTVAGLVFEVTSATEIEDAEGDDIPLSSLEVGMTVEARGDRALNGTITATRIRVQDEGDGGSMELEFCTSSMDLNTGDTFNIRDYVQVKDNPSQPVDWQQVYFTYTEAGANNPTNPTDWNLSAFNAGQNVTITEADGAPGTGNEGQGRYQIYIVREGQSEFDDDFTFRVDDDRDSEVDEAKCNSTSASKQQASSGLMGTPRAAFAAVTVGTDVIFIGGFNRGPLDLTQRLDSAGVVTTLTPLPTARGSLSAAAISDTIYVIGGRDGTDRVLADVQRLAIAEETWTSMPRLGTAREGSAAATLDGALFVFGGRDPNGRVLASVETLGDINTSLEQPDAPSDFVLAPNYPNPFSNTTTISFSVSAKAAGRSVHLTVFDVRGRHIATLVDGVLSPGLHDVSWNGLGSDGMRVGSGVYFYRLQQGDFVARQMMAIIR